MIFLIGYVFLKHYQSAARVDRKPKKMQLADWIPEPPDRAKLASWVPDIGKFFQDDDTTSTLEDHGYQSIY